MEYLKIQKFYIRSLFKSNYAQNNNNAKSIFKYNYNISLKFTNEDINKEKHKAFPNGF